MAAGAGLLVLACTVTARLSGSIRMKLTYEENRGVMLQVLQACEGPQWQLMELAADAAAAPLGLLARRVWC